MKKPIEVGQRVAVYMNEKRICQGTVMPDRTNDSFVVNGDNGINYYVYRENLRILKPKPKRVCHCNREPDRWALYNKDGDYFCTYASKKEAIQQVKDVVMMLRHYVVPCWLGPKEEVK